ncbi:IS3 family transposase [Vibrio breoganii]|uniref:IS3 family transposase n=2 Tax=Vibrio breoganii TaxID=553239 RepID=UPI000C81AD30|nr:IS3 family transposase [Vibrio breoganii]
MPRYSIERKEAVLKKLLPPHNLSVPQVAEEEGISEVTLYNWRSQLKESGVVAANSQSSSEQWSAQTKLAVVAETFSMTESELSQYCREKGLFPEQVQRWKEESLYGFKSAREREAEAKQQAKADKNEIKALKKELKYKEKALAETAALLVLRKKLRAFVRGGARGRLTPLLVRKKVIALIQEATNSGARLELACKEAGIGLRTYRRWLNKGTLTEDGRPNATRPEPRNKLTPTERAQIITVCNSKEFKSLPPSQIVPTLLDQGEYIASEATYYRVLKQEGQLNQRGRQRKRRGQLKPTSYSATGANQVFTWDITYLPSPVKGLYYYLYLIEDIFSRKIVGWEVHHKECGQLAAELLQRTVHREQCFKKPLVLHSDNGAPMKSLTMRAKVEELGITASFSRPRVSDDNPFVESLFRTLKYAPAWPTKGFSCLSDSRSWVQKFVHWYNTQHKHSAINYVTPHQKHEGLDIQILAQRKRVLEQKRQKHPNRWSGNIRCCVAVERVDLNPEKEQRHVA